MHSKFTFHPRKEHQAWKQHPGHSREGHGRHRGTCEGEGSVVREDMKAEHSLFLSCLPISSGKHSFGFDPSPIPEQNGDPMFSLQLQSLLSFRAIPCEGRELSLPSPAVWEVNPCLSLIIIQLQLTCLTEIWSGLLGQRRLCFYNRIWGKGDKGHEWVLGP